MHVSGEGWGEGGVVRGCIDAGMGRGILGGGAGGGRSDEIQ